MDTVVIYSPAPGPASGGNFAGVTPSSSGAYSQSNGTGTTMINTFNIENAADTRVIVAVCARLDRDGISLTMGGTDAGSAIIDVDQTGSITLFSMVVANVSTVEIIATCTNPNWDDSGMMVWHARDCTVGTPQEQNTAAQSMTNSLTVSANSSVIVAGVNNNATSGASSTGVGVSSSLDYVDSTWGGNDFMAGGHIDSLGAGTASYGIDWASTPGNGSVISFEVSQA